MPLMRANVLLLFCFTAALRGADLRLGIIGTDTSHVSVFSKAFNDATSKDHVPGAKVVAAFKGGSPDIESSISRVEEILEILGLEILEILGRNTGSA